MTRPTPLTRTLIATLTAEPDEWTVATLAEDLDVSCQGVRNGLRAARRAGYTLRLALSEEGARLRDMDTEGKSAAHIARELGVSRDRMLTVERELLDHGITVHRRMRRHKSTSARILELYAAHPYAHPMKWYAERVPTTLRAVRDALERLNAKGKSPPIVNWVANHGDRIALAQLLTEAGRPREEIAAELGVRPETVRDYLHRPERHRVRRPPTPLAAKIAMINGAR